MSKKDNGNETQNSTIFSDPKAQRKTDKKSKTVLKKVGIIVLVLVLVFAVIPYMAVKIITTIKADQKRAEIPTLYEAVEQTKADAEAKNLFDLKTDAEVDNIAVTKILDELGLVENAGECEILCSSGKVTLKFKFAPHKSRADWFENTMVKYSCAVLTLASKVDEVAWEYPSIDKIHSFKRSEVKDFLGYPATEFASSPEAVQVLLNRLGLNEY